ARHAVVDLALVLKTPPQACDPERLPGDQLQQLREQLRQTGLDVAEGEAVAAQLAEVRGTYEPFLNALARRLMFALPAVVPEQTAPDNWQTSAWLPRAPGLGNLPMATGSDRHFDSLAK